MLRSSIEWAGALPRAAGGSIPLLPNRKDVNTKEYDSWQSEIRWHMNMPFACRLQSRAGVAVLGVNGDAANEVAIFGDPGTGGAI